MNERLEPFDLYRGVEAVNALREAEVTWQNIGFVRAALSDGGGSLAVQNELKRLEYTHTAVTWDAVQAGDRLRMATGGPFYEVTYIIDGGRRRMHQLFLKAVEAPPERSAP